VPPVSVNTHHPCAVKLLVYCCCHVHRAAVGLLLLLLLLLSSWVWNDALQLLHQVWSASRQGSSLQEVLQPVRQLKPVHGGPGWDAEVGTSLRLLNFHVGSGQSCAELEE